MLVVAFVVGVPVFFSVGLVLLIPIIFTIARETKSPLLYLGIPLCAGLSVAHGLVPPHPGPMVAIEKLGADVGKTILYSILIGLPTAVVAGPLFGKFISSRIKVELGGIGMQLSSAKTGGTRPGFGLTLMTILLPVILMLVATTADLSLPKDNRLRAWADFVGSPLVAMLVAVLFSFWSFGKACGFNREQILKFTEDCVGPAASILLVVGAGGGFSKVLDYAGVDDAIAAAVKRVHVSPLLLGWVVAALIRVAVGSATVAITMAVGDHGAGGGGHAGPQSRVAGAGDGRGIAGAVAPQRRRLLVREGVFQPDRAANAQDLDGDGNDHLRGRAWVGDVAELSCLKRETVCHANQSSVGVMEY